jgi:hypothetical protein
MRLLKSIIIIVIAFFVALPLFAAEFTADSRVESSGQTKQAVFYFAPGKWRMNENAPEGKRATIFRKDTKTITILWPDKKLYVTRPVPENEYKMLSNLKPGEELERTELGKETVSGYPTTKYRVKYQLRNKQFTVIEWYSKSFGVAVKTRAEDNSRTAEVTNIKKVKLGKNIFEVPSDYRPLTKKDLSEINPPPPAH